MHAPPRPQLSGRFQTSPDCVMQPTVAYALRLSQSANCRGRAPRLISMSGDRHPSAPDAGRARTQRAALHSQLLKRRSKLNKRILTAILFCLTLVSQTAIAATDDAGAGDKV